MQGITPFPFAVSQNVHLLKRWVKICFVLYGDTSKRICLGSKMSTFLDPETKAFALGTGHC